MIHILVWAIKAMIIFIKLGAFGIDIAPFLEVLMESLPEGVFDELLPGEETTAAE